MRPSRSTKTSDRRLRPFAALGLICTLLAAAAPAIAQFEDLSPAQREMLENLPRDQRDDVAQRIQEREDGDDDREAADTRDRIDRYRVEEADREARARMQEHYAEPSSIERRLQRRLTSEGDDEDAARMDIEGALHQFGYDLFSSRAGFPRAENIPVPERYQIGPGDVLEVIFYGQENAQHRLSVDGEGQIHFPEVGPMTVAGRSLAEVRELIGDTMEEHFVGVQASVSMGQLRSMQVFVTGDVHEPGSYTVSSLATLSNALLSSGGVRRIGSLRNVRVMRDGEVETTFDLYDLLLEGDISDDIRLRDGDVVHVPAIGPTVAVGGEVTRPAIYELRQDLSVGRLLDMAGGATPEADQGYAEISRRTPQGYKTVDAIDLGDEDDLEKTLRDGDVLRVYEAPDMAESIITLRGHVRRPGSQEWQEGMRLDEAIGSVETDLLPGADLDYAVIARETGAGRALRAFSVSIDEALSAPDSDANVELEQRDQIFVFGTQRGSHAQDQDHRAEVLEPLVHRLQAQSRQLEAPETIGVRGHIRFPGTYPWEEGMRVEDAIRAGLDVRSNPDLEYALLVRRDGPRREVTSFRLEEVFSEPDGPANIALEPGDELLVFSDGEAPEQNEDEQAAPAPRDEAQRRAQDIEDATRRVDQLMAGTPSEIDGREISREDVQRRAAEEGISEHAAARQLVAEAQAEGAQHGEQEESQRPSVHETTEKVTRQHYEPDDDFISRRRMLDPLIEELNRQARASEPAPVTRVSGAVRVPGQYPLEPGMRVSDLVRAGSGLDESAYELRGELTRYEVIDGERREVTHRTIHIARALQGDPEHDLELQPHDRLRVKQIPGWTQQFEVELQGEVRFPGTYSVRPGETMTDVLERAGGLTERAYPRGAVFTRERLREQEAERMERMTQRLQRDIATLRLREGEDLEGLQQLQELLVGIAEIDAVGRLAIDLPGIIEGQRNDINLKDGDQLVIPDEPQEVTVMGEVQQPTSHLHRPGMTREDYIDRSGGTTRLADANRAFVVHANGEVSGRGSSRWFARATPVQPGDTIIVPFNPDRMSAMELVSDVSSIFYQLGVAVAAWDTVGVF